MYGVCKGRRVQCMVKECPTGYEHAFVDSQCCPVCLRCEFYFFMMLTSFFLFFCRSDVAIERISTNRVKPL